VFLCTVMVRATLPPIIPPSYKGATLRYHYYIKSTLSGRLMALENSQFYKESTKEFIEVVSLLDFCVLFLGSVGAVHCVLFTLIV